MHLRPPSRSRRHVVPLGPLLRRSSSGSAAGRRLRRRDDVHRRLRRRLPDLPLRPRLRRRRAAPALMGPVERDDEQPRELAAELAARGARRRRPLVCDGGAVHEEQRGSPHRLRLEDTHRPSSRYRPGADRRIPGGRERAHSSRGGGRRRSPTRARRGTPRRVAAASSCEDVLHHPHLAVVHERDVDVRARDQVDRDLAARGAAHREPDAVAARRRREQLERRREHRPRPLLGPAEEAPRPLPRLDPRAPRARRARRRAPRRARSSGSRTASSSSRPSGAQSSSSCVTSPGCSSPQPQSNSTR